jgi:hypothetical protein
LLNPWCFIGYLEIILLSFDNAPVISCLEQAGEYKEGDMSTRFAIEVDY